MLFKGVVKTRLVYIYNKTTIGDINCQWKYIYKYYSICFAAPNSDTSL